MCNEYRTHVPSSAITEAFSQLKIPLRFPEGVPNIEPRDSVRITDRAAVVRAGTDGGGAALVTMRWSWPGPGGKPVYNYRSDGRRLGGRRVLIPASGFYEFTTAEAGAKRKTKWLFVPARSEAGAALVPQGAEPAWFGIAGLWQPSDAGESFTMLTAPPGPDIAPYHDRGIVLLPVARWAAWLGGEDAAGLLGPVAAGSLQVLRITDQISARSR